MEQFGKFIWTVFLVARSERLTLNVASLNGPLVLTLLMCTLHYVCCHTLDFVKLDLKDMFQSYVFVGLQIFICLVVRTIVSKSFSDNSNSMMLTQWYVIDIYISSTDTTKLILQYYWKPFEVDFGCHLRFEDSLPMVALPHSL